MGAGEEGSGERSSKLFTIISRQGSDKPNSLPVGVPPDLTLSFLGLLVIAGGVRLQRVAAAVERIVSVLVIKDACEADLPLIAMAAEVRVQTQAAAVQILQPTGEQVLHVSSSFIIAHLRFFGSYLTTDHEWFCARAGEAGKSLSQESGDLQQQLTGSHLQSKGAATLRRIDRVFGAGIDQK